MGKEQSDEQKAARSLNIAADLQECPPVFVARLSSILFSSFRLVSTFQRNGGVRGFSESTFGVLLLLSNVT